MTDHINAAQRKEYMSAAGTLMIENIVKGGHRKTDVIRGIIESMALQSGEASVLPAYGNAADSGEHEGGEKI